MSDMKVATDILRWLAQIEGTVTIHDGTATDESGLTVDLNQWRRGSSEPHVVSAPSGVPWCKNCNRPRTLHGAFARCPGGKTQFEEDQ